jgi:hypothetical protein
MIYGYKYEPLIIRVPTLIDTRYQIQGFDLDNLYPQRAKETRNRSYTLRIACLRYAAFLNGDGFVDKKLADLVVNARGRRKLTANDTLDKTSESTGWANGFYIHVGYNLQYKVNSIKLLPYEFNRYGMPGDEDGDFCDIKYCTNWENNPYKNRNKMMEIFDYPVFNPDPAVVAEQIELAGGILNYKGQIYHWAPEENEYPKATFDTVFDQAQTQAEIAILDLAMEQNGFKAGHVISHPGKFEGNEKKEFVDDVNSFTGQGAGGVLILENPDGNLKINEMIATLQMQNTDSMHVNVDKRVKDAMRVCFGMPPEILGEMPESGMFNKQQMQDAYDYYNTVTGKQRKAISGAFREIMQHWQEPVTENYDIQEMQYIKGSVAVGAPGAAPAGPGAQPGGPAAPVEPGGSAAAAPLVVNENLKNLSGKQAINFNRILRQYSKGTTGRMATLLQLRSGFGMSDQEIKDLLNSIDEENLAEAAPANTGTNG